MNGKRVRYEEAVDNFWDIVKHDVQLPLRHEELEAMFRCITPCQDKSRKYSIQETTLVKLLMDALGISGTAAGNRLSRWKLGALDPYTVTSGQGDLGQVVEQAFAGLKTMPSRLHSLLRLCELLHELALTSRWSTVEADIVPRSPTEIIRELYLYQRPQDCKWVTRIILKNMYPIHLEWEGIMARFHPVMTAVHRMQSNLKNTCLIMTKIMQDGYSRKSMFDGSELNIVTYSNILQKYCPPKVGSLVSTMECIQAKSIHHVYTEITAEQAFYAEIKYDGERMQIHVESGEVIKITIFSKSGRNSTQDRIDSHGIIKQALGLDGQNRTSVFNCILEGERLVFDEQTNQIEKFGGVSSFRFGNGPKDGTRHLYIVFYDLLFLNDSNYIRTPLEYRRKKLEEIIIPIPKYVGSV